MATLASRLRRDDDRGHVTHELSCCVERLQMAEADRDFFRGALMRTTLYYREVWDIEEDALDQDVPVARLETKLNSAEHRITEQAAVVSMATNALAGGDEPVRLVAQVLMLRAMRAENDGEELRVMRRAGRPGARTVEPNQPYPNQPRSTRRHSGRKRGVQKRTTRTTPRRIRSGRSRQEKEEAMMTKL